MGASDNGIGDYAQELGIKNSGSGLLALRGFAYVSQIGSVNDGVAQLFTSNVFHSADNLTLILGRHMIKTGGQVMRQQVNTFYAGNNGRPATSTFPEGSRPPMR